MNICMLLVQRGCLLQKDVDMTARVLLFTRDDGTNRETTGEGPSLRKTQAGHVERMGDEKMAKRADAKKVDGKKMRGRPKLR